MRLVVLIALCGCGRIAFDLQGNGDGGNGDGANGDGAALGPDAIAPLASCGSIAMLGDDFNDGSTSAWATPAVINNWSIGETAGALEIRSGGGGSMGAGYWQSVGTYDMRGARVSARLSPFADTTHGLEIRIWNLDANAERKVAVTGGLTQGSWGSVAYDGIGHALVGMRVDAGILYYEASPDGVAWTVLAMESAPVWTTAAYVTLEGNGAAGGVSNDRGAFELLNAATTAWCTTP